MHSAVESSSYLFRKNIIDQVVQIVRKHKMRMKIQKQTDDDTENDDAPDQNKHRQLEVASEQIQYPEHKQKIMRLKQQKQQQQQTKRNWCSIHAIVPDNDDEQRRLIVFKQPISDELRVGLNSIVQNADLREKKYECEETYETIADVGVALDRILPQDIVRPSSYEIVGHIAHLNLTPEQCPWRHVIGQVLLDKHASTLRTVVNKVAQIESVYRTFEMEIIAGDDDLEATVSQNGCQMRLNLRKVYWNSRLETEHRRLTSLISDNQVFVDMMCGIGPFAIPAAKQHQCVVLANDLNPDSYFYLCKNRALNGITDQRLLAFNMDARAFMRMVAQQQLTGTLIPPQKSHDTSFIHCEPWQNIHHVAMNLPASAVEFLDVFRGLYSNTSSEMRKQITMPLIHLYCFSATDPLGVDVLQRIREVLDASFDSIIYSNIKAATTSKQGKQNQLLNPKCDTASSTANIKCKTFKYAFNESIYQKLDDNAAIIHHVRTVAPKKEMLCISFRLPRNIAFTPSLEKTDDTLTAHIQKRTRTDSDSPTAIGVG